MTETALLEASRHVGLGDKHALDVAATDAMRRTLGEMQIAGRVVIGEGEMDQAPMLHIGEELGAGLKVRKVTARGLPRCVAVVYWVRPTCT